ncbi:hypothetical protein ICV32_02960 [Polynucleobacter sp. MWH-UH24A]|uniref:hypothetical protein n=1 Tax=Polynucleobacter sp. MWH-UH24A TaxID=2689110 RepID=UPI001BFD2B36|nr:hypothetical protein [Polynucleobacter sp. MWH-UH24A]QWD76639.1 hypothetical protein ICV32_02960 [Polynucleobacter sp. MWH-UH24A]
MKRLIIFVLFSLSSSLVYSSTYDCRVTRKIGPENIVSDSELMKWKFSIKIYDITKPELERCSFVPSQNKVTCDRYTVDRVETDKFVGIKKFYYFTGQFDVQLYPDMRFVENNGRGGISYGSCVKL